MTQQTLKSLIGALLLASLPFATRAQEPFRCGTDLMRQRAIAADPHLLSIEAQLEEFTWNWVAEHRGERQDDSTVFTIPVVFHILHMDGPENISNEQILDEMEVLNRDYRKLNSDVNDVCCGFQDIAADICLQFKLATIDPMGHCTNGIDRIRTVETFVGDNGSKLNWWPRDKYLNIWTCTHMEDGVAGYSQYPSAVEGPNAPADGVIILHDYIGRSNTELDWTGQDGRSRAVTHEVGHYLNLQHVWGDNNGAGDPPFGHMIEDCGDDDVDDTPFTRGWNICPSVAQSKNCNDTIAENFENYMEYSYCSKMFTEGQKLRMRAALASGLGQRNSLYTAENLAATGVNGVTDQHCAPIADLYCFTDAVTGSNTTTPQGTHYYCIGDQVRFFDNSRNAMATSWQWTFEDGEPATSTEQNPTVTFTAGGGWKTVSLTVSNDQGSSTKVDEHGVYISDPWSYIPGAVHEDFEADCSDCPYFSENYENNYSAWQRANDAGHSGGSSMVLNGFDTYGINDYFIDNGANDIDALVTPTMDLTWLDDGQLTFWYACATKTSNLEDVTERLEVWSSITCGRTWSLRATLDTSNLITGGATSMFYVPQGGTEWHQAAIDLNSTLATDHVRFKFVYYSSSHSNNLYIDDININGTVGFGEATTEQTGLSLMPNPTAGELDLTYTLPGEGVGGLTMMDAQGRTVWSRPTRNVAQERVHIDTHALGLAPGVYVVRLSHERGQRTERLVVR
jgi:hypothetical protein